MTKIMAISFRVSLLLTALFFFVTSITSFMWGLAFVTSKSFGLEVVSWFWVFAGPITVVALSSLAMFVSWLLFGLLRAISR